MKHFIDKYYPSLTTSIIAIISLILGGCAYKYSIILTDFEILLVTISIFMLLKGTIMFIKLWATEL